VTEALTDRKVGFASATANPRELRLRKMLLASMLAAVAVVGFVAYLRERAEAKAALEDFEHEQVLLARALGVGTASLVANPASRDESAELAAKLFDQLGRPTGRTILVAPPGSTTFRQPNGRPAALPSHPADRAFEPQSMRVAPLDAARLGLPSRLAVAGLARTHSSPPYALAIVSTAARERDRGRSGPMRLVLSVLLAAGLVGGFGGFALRTQRKELLLEGELAMAALRSERDARLEKLRRVATLGTLSMGIAHELATPLGVIAVRAEQLFERLIDDERGRRAVATIKTQCDLISQTVRGLLTLARGDTPAMRPVAAHLLARESVELVEHRFAAAGVALEISAPTNLRPVQVDRHLAVLALVNLLLNACDACEPEGRVQLVVEDADALVRFAVIDNGTGISPEVARKLSEPLFTTKPLGAGTGLGLAIVSEIVKSHQGRLDIRPGPSRGTVAAIFYPPASPRTERTA
jgi:two-component system NtrC family sensor kinase